MWWKVVTWARTEASFQCLLLGRMLPNRVSLPDDTFYKQQQEGYWSQQQRELQAPCRITPETVAEVSQLIQHLGDTQTVFAVKSGGHSSVLGASNLGSPNGNCTHTKGIVIDLSGFHEISLTEDRSAVWLGTGLRWGTVYHALDIYNLTVAGGRDGDVGVGGYILGGGMSWHANQVGWVCDNVLEFEVVVGNGSILRASATEHTDLFWALKGSGSAFGIVTRFKLPTIKGTEVWAGGIQYAEDKVADLFRTLQDQGGITSTKTHAFGYLSFVWLQKTRQYIRSAFVMDVTGQTNSTIIKRWEIVPYSMKSLDRSSIARIADGSNSENLRGFRYPEVHIMRL